MASVQKRLGKDGVRWLARVRRHGHPEQTKTFDTKAAADSWTRAVEREMDTGSFIPSDSATHLTFTKAAERYKAEALPRLRGKAQAEYVVNRVIEHFGKYSLALITPHLLSEYRDVRLRVVAPQTVIHELSMVSRIFKMVTMDWGIALPKGNPVDLTRKPQISNDRNRRLVGDEEARLMTALLGRESPWPHAAAVLAIETAARQGELLALKWSEVDLERRTARLRGRDGGITKNGDEWRDVPLSSIAVNLLKSLPRSTSARILPISQNALQIARGGPAIGNAVVHERERLAA